ncbi:hypothetical protein TNCV_3169881 [Trichonephila clavipes]|nr:hypothetical protein TNCV_3169881 [Trichonephila clavipes]
MMYSDAVRINLNECMKNYDYYIVKGFFAMLPVLGKKAVLEWSMKEGLIGSSYVCPKWGKSIEFRERTGRHSAAPSKHAIKSRMNNFDDWICPNEETNRSTKKCLYSSNNDVVRKCDLLSRRRK